MNKGVLRKERESHIIIIEMYVEKDRWLYAAFLDMEKAVTELIWDALWDNLILYGVGGHLGWRSGLIQVCACFCTSEWEVKWNSLCWWGRHGCALSPWLFNVYIEGHMRNIIARVANLDARLTVIFAEQSLVEGLFAGGWVLLAKNKRMQHKFVDAFVHGLLNANQ